MYFFFYENAYNECVSSVCNNEKYDFLLIANLTRDYPIKNKSESEFSIYENERDFIINPNNNLDMDDNIDIDGDVDGFMNLRIF